MLLVRTLDIFNLLLSILLRGVHDGVDAVDGAVECLDELRELCYAGGVTGEEERPEVVQKFGRGVVGHREGVEGGLAEAIQGSWV